MTIQGPPEPMKAWCGYCGGNVILFWTPGPGGFLHDDDDWGFEHEPMVVVGDIAAGNGPITVGIYHVACFYRKLGRVS